MSERLDGDVVRNKWQRLTDKTAYACDSVPGVGTIHDGSKVATWKSCIPHSNELNLDLLAECIFKANGEGYASHIRALIELVREWYLFEIVARQEPYLRATSI